MDELVQRAFAAWFRSGGTDQPSVTESGIKRHKKMAYVILRNTRGTLAVYRVRNDGILKRLKRWPIEVAEPEKEK